MRGVLSVVLFFLTIVTGLSQNLTQDTLFIPFPETETNNLQFRVTEVNDLRKEKEINVLTIRKYFLLPVDVYVFTRPPTDMALIVDHEKAKKNYQVDVHRFYLDERKGNFSSALIVDAEMDLFEKSPDTSVFLGKLLFQTEYRKKAFEKDTVAYRKTLEAWKSQFYRDLNTITIAGDQSFIIMDNFLVQKEMDPLDLNVNVSTAIGKNWWLLEGELMFTPPEIKRRNVYVANIFRYQNHREFESFAFGWKSEKLLIRMNDLFAFSGTGNILIGVNKWRNLEEIKRGLEQIPNLNISFTQTLAFKPKNGWLYGNAGIMENMFYIYDLGLNLNRVCTFHLG
ncbi:MAG: hypothetical protein HC906_19100 [Bacteroidales bacterium]|nr:hypothetical protein [Bacteroidales bacterium]